MIGNKEKETRDDVTSNTLTELLAILYVSIVILGLFFKILFG